jgi:two-component system, OmpR family, response regulator
MHTPLPDSFLTVLLVEDSPLLSARLSESLLALDHVNLVGTVQTEAEAVASVRRRAVDVIILDLQLKQGTGFGVMRALATASHKPQIIVLTNYDLPEYRQSALALGAAHFLDKARDFTLLPNLLRSLQPRNERTH